MAGFFKQGLRDVESRQHITELRLYASRRQAGSTGGALHASSSLDRELRRIEGREIEVPADSPTRRAPAAPRRGLDEGESPHQPLCSEIPKRLVYPLANPSGSRANKFWGRFSVF